ncbi:Murein DD-endopeptidase MepH [Thauera sp. GDN1]|uniref:C40 family peptidase n=1 Tax=Thauera sp. GDN1 TaxID=2944810 RepID=UPI002478E676|nr:C40 family peptidase [Thauera sp. GDN1]WEN42545.1 Murein DD-endopeptidase MepH [Thauera sp. GDN1]
MFLRPALLSLALLLASAPFAHAAEQPEQAVAQVEQSSVIGEYTVVAEQLVDEALSYLGIRYRFGGTSPATGLDCSGLVLNVFRNAVGLNLPRTAGEMAKLGDRIGRQELKPGDLVFFNTMRRAFSHVGIYLGDGKFVHAPSSGGKVRVENISNRYWAQRFNGARRLLDEGDTLHDAARMVAIR